MLWFIFGVLNYLGLCFLFARKEERDRRCPFPLKISQMLVERRRPGDSWVRGIIKKQIHALYDDSTDICEKDQKIDKATLFIDAEFRTCSLRIKLADFITCGILNLTKNIMPIEAPISLTLYFENLYDEPIAAQNNVAYGIQYPGLIIKQEKIGPMLVEKTPRGWKLNLPQLNEKGESALRECEHFFKPEVPGDHTLIITHSKWGTVTPSVKLQYAGLHGVSGRIVKQITGNWKAHFYVTDGTQARLLFIAGSALLVSILTVVLSVILHLW